MSQSAPLLSTKAEVIAAAEELVKDHMKSYDPSHDWYHVDRVRRTALALARSLAPEPVDLVILELAALFHDISDAKYSPTSTTHSLLTPFFESIAPSVLDPSAPATIARIVDSVSWSKEQKLRAKGEWDDGFRNINVELKCVQDADRLDAIGGFGIMRCTAYSAAVNRALFIKPGEPGAKDTAIQHFDDKLFKIQGDAMKTPLGRQLAEKRQALMRAFYDGVQEEYALLDTM